eukprot:2671942-Pyramimonas_sp.AAC.1
MMEEEEEEVEPGARKKPESSDLEARGTPLARRGARQKADSSDLEARGYLPAEAQDTRLTRTISRLVAGRLECASGREVLGRSGQETPLALDFESLSHASTASFGAVLARETLGAMVGGSASLLVGAVLRLGRRGVLAR